MTGLSFQYPAWFAIFCVALGAIYALGLYYKSKVFMEQANRLNWTLGILRFLAGSLLSLLLLSPVLKSLITETKKPVVILAQDASEFIVNESNTNTHNKSLYNRLFVFLNLPPKI